MSGFLKIECTIYIRKHNINKTPYITMKNAILRAYLLLMYMFLFFIWIVYYSFFHGCHQHCIYIYMNTCIYIHIYTCIVCVCVYIYIYIYIYKKLALVAQRLKRLPPMWEIWVWSLGREDPLRRKWQPTPVFLPGKSHRWRSLAGYSPCMGLQKVRHDSIWAFPFHHVKYSVLSPNHAYGSLIHPLMAELLHD